MCVERQTDNQQDEEKVQQTPQKTLKYYFNRFRYYHYWVAEKVDAFIGAVCFAIIKVCFFLMRWELGMQSDEAIDEKDVEDEY